MNQTELQNLLRTHLTEAQIRNPAYSIRAFAKRLGLGFGTLSQVLGGKRKLAPKSVQKILDRLGVGPETRSLVLNGPKQKLSYEYSKLAADQYFILSEWYYLGILNLVRTKNFQSSPEHIAERLGLSKTLITQALDRLIRVGLIKRVKGKLVRTQVALSTTDGIPDMAIKKSHYQSLDRARVALDEHPFESYDTTWLTFAFDPRQMAAAKKKIRDFQDEFSEQFSTSKEATQVYRLAMQLFSLSQPTNDQEKNQ